MEDLMIPRYKVIADYPGCFAIVGSVWDEDVIINYLLQNDERYINKYPHLFKELYWWEERKPEDMPMYVKSKSFDNEIILARVEWKFEDNTMYSANLDFTNQCWIEPFKMHPDITPATEIEYNNYINSKLENK